MSAVGWYLMLAGLAVMWISTFLALPILIFLLGMVAFIIGIKPTIDDITEW